MGKRVLDEDRVESAAKVPSQSYAHAFKILCPDVLCSAILGSGGEVIQKIQTETESKISLAGRNDSYENTQSRLCLIRAHNTESIDAALVAICAALKDVIEEAKKPEADLAGIMTKNGDYRVKCVMPKTAAGAMIGTKGSNVNEIREATGIHVVWVEDGTVNDGDLAEQVVSLVGSIDSISSCLVRMSVFVQDQSSESWFSDWAHLRVGVKGATAVKAVKNVDLGPVSRHSSENDMVNRALNALPIDAMDRQFCVRTSLPVASMSALIGKGGCTTKDIFQQTGAKVTLKDEDPNTTVSIEGSVQGVLSGYCLIMKKYLEFEKSQVGVVSQPIIEKRDEEVYERKPSRKYEEYTSRTVVKSASKGSGKSKGASRDTGSSGKGKGKSQREKGKGKGKGKAKSY